MRASIFFQVLATAPFGIDLELADLFQDGVQVLQFAMGKTGAGLLFLQRSDQFGDLPVQPGEVIAGHFIQQAADEQKLLSRHRAERLRGLRFLVRLLADDGHKRLLSGQNAGGVAMQISRDNEASRTALLSSVRPILPPCTALWTWNQPS